MPPEIEKYPSDFHHLRIALIQATFSLLPANCGSNVGYQTDIAFTNILKCFCGKNTVEPILIGGGKGREKGREKAEFIACKTNERSYFSVDFYIILFAIQHSQDCPD